MFSQLRYPMKAITFSEEQWTAVIDYPLRIGLQSSGIVSTIPQELVFSPIKYQGFGCLHPYVSQEIYHIQALVDHGYNPEDSTGKLFRCEAEQLLLELGTGDGLFQHNFESMNSIATHCYLLSTWHFTQKYGIHICTDIAPIPTQCPGDEFLTTAFLRVYPSQI